MNQFINYGVQLWRTIRNRKMLQSRYSAQYAFVGAGSHALQNLYPVLQNLGISLKYICCKSPEKLELIERRFDVVATTSLDTILNDSDVKGIFVCVSPAEHYGICTRVISSGKYLFVEKPPCRTLQELENLIESDVNEKVMVGMQKRYSPLIQALKERLSKSGVISYTMSYHMGAYPEGDPLNDLFIHPVDLAAYMFGEAQKITVQRTDRKGTVTLQALLSHCNVKGIIEVSTAYSWTNPEELLRVNTVSGEYRLEQMERLTYHPHPKIIVGIPVEKLGLFTTSEKILIERNNFNPLIINNQLYTQGFFSEIKAFAEMVEYEGENLSKLSDMRKTYIILECLKS